MNDIIKSLEDSGLVLKGVSETIQNEVKEQKGGCLSLLLGTLGAALLKNMIAGKAFVWQILKYKSIIRICRYQKT